jgi:ligand-binding sensor domain-containing protein
MTLCWVRSICSDSFGNLWFDSPTSSIVLQLDGVRWIAHDLGDVVLDMYADRDGNVWFGTEDRGVLRFDGTAWATFRSGEIGGDSTVYSICQDGRGDMWFVVGLGVKRFDGQSWVTYGPDEGITIGVIDKPLGDSRGNVWFPHGYLNGREGLLRFDGTRWELLTVADGLPDDGVRPLFEDRDGSLWFGTAGRVARFDGTRWRVFTADDGLLSDNVAAGIQDRDGTIWFAHARASSDQAPGATRFDGRSWRIYTEVQPNCFPMSTVAEDESGNIWFAAGYGGVLRFDKSEARLFSQDDGLGGDFVGDVTTSRSGDLWVATVGGLSHFDGELWTTYTAADGLGGDHVQAVCEGPDGSVWAGVLMPYMQSGPGIARFLNGEWTTYQWGEDWKENSVYCIYLDRVGMLWFGTSRGLIRRYDGVDWEVTDVAFGGYGPSVWDILVARNGDLWLATLGGGAMRFDGVEWRTFDESNSIVANSCFSVAEDRAGNIWVGGHGGAYRFDGTGWVKFSDELGSSSVYDIYEDDRGALWFGGNNLRRFAESEWRAIAPLGTTSIGTNCISQDSSRSFWIGSGSGLLLYEPDYVPPRTILIAKPPGVSASRAQSVACAAALGEAQGVEFAYRLDGLVWSAWSSANTWSDVGLPDGTHVVEARARDWMGNIDPTPAVAQFEIDASPPVPEVTLPASGQAVRDSIAVVGTAADSRFKGYRVAVRSSSGALLDTLAESGSPVTDGVLCGWNTLPLQDGDYEVRLSVTDTLGLTGTALVRVVVDNHEPWANETAPATLRSGAGGDIYTTNGEVHLYFPPHGFDRDTEVNIVSLSESDVPDTLESGARLVFSGYEISWGGAELAKAAILEMSYAEVRRQVVPTEGWSEAWKGGSRWPGQSGLARWNR